MKEVHGLETLGDLDLGKIVVMALDGMVTVVAQGMQAAATGWQEMAEGQGIGIEALQTGWQELPARAVERIEMGLAVADNSMAQNVAVELDGAEDQKALRFHKGSAFAQREE